MTSERLLLGRGRSIQLTASDILPGVTPQRTSRPEEYPDAFSEPTATIVCGSLLQLGVKPHEFVLWNAFPWHSFDPCRGVSSNRMHNKSEQAAGLPVLKAFRDSFPCHQVVALGRIAAAQLQELGVTAIRMRHPASGGAKLFREQIGNVLARMKWRLSWRALATASRLWLRPTNRDRTAPSFVNRTLGVERWTFSSS
jgi:hypothetical protein